MATIDKIMDFDSGDHTMACNSLIVNFQTVQIQFVHLWLPCNLHNNYTAETATKTHLSPTN